MSFEQRVRRLEEIVGDIRDEFDLGRGPVFEHTESEIVVSGIFSMRRNRRTQNALPAMGKIRVSDIIALF